MQCAFSAENIAQFTTFEIIQINGSLFHHKCNVCLWHKLHSLSLSLRVSQLLMKQSAPID